MSRRLLALSAAAVTVLTLAACDDNGGDEEENGTEAAAGPEVAEVAGGEACAEHEPLMFSDTGVDGLETLVL